MPSPPRRGVGVSCQRSSDGSATSRRASEVRRSAQIAAAQAGSAAIAAMVLTGPEGNRTPLARCEDGIGLLGRMRAGLGSVRRQGAGSRPPYTSPVAVYADLVR